MRLVTPFGCSESQRLLARSQTALIQAAKAFPALPAAASQRSLRSLDSLSSYRSSSGLATGGLPRGRFMGELCPYKIYLAIPS
jgi:hypothetical protein